MCSGTLHCIFNLVLIASCAVLMGSIFAPAWQTYKARVEDRANQGETKKRLGDTANTVISTGLFLEECFGDFEGCATAVWDRKTSYERITLALLATAVAVCAVTLVWSCVAQFGCCCKTAVLSPLPMFAFVACLLNAAGILVYALHTDAMRDNLEQVFDVRQPKFGYSLYLAVIGSVGLAGAVILGIAMVCLSKSSTPL